MTTSNYSHDFREKFYPQEWNNLTEMQRDVMSQQFELYEALRRTGSDVVEPSFMLANHNKARHSPCSRCSGDGRYIAQRAMIVKELEDELEEQHQRRLSQQADKSPVVSARKQRGNVLIDPIRANWMKVDVASKSTEKKPSSAVQRRKQDSEPRERTSTKQRARSRTEKPRKRNSDRKNSHSKNRAASDLYNSASCYQRSMLRNKTSMKRSSEISDKTSSEERSKSCEDQELEGKGFRILTNSQNVTSNRGQETSPSLATSDTTPTDVFGTDSRVTFDAIDEILHHTRSMEDQAVSLRRLLIEKAKKKVIPNENTYPSSNHLSRNKKQVIPKTVIALSLPTIQRKRNPRKEQARRGLRAEKEDTAEKKDFPRCKLKSLPRGDELRKERSNRKEPKETNRVNLSPSPVTNTSNGKRSLRSTKQPCEWSTSTSIDYRTNDNILLQPPKAQQSERRRASNILEPKRIITSRKVEQNMESCNKTQKKRAPKNSRRHPKKKLVCSVCKKSMGDSCLQEQGGFHGVSADKTYVFGDTYTSKVSSTSYLPRHLLGCTKVGGYWNSESLNYGRGDEKIPHFVFKGAEPCKKEVQFDTPRLFSIGTSTTRNKLHLSDKKKRSSVLRREGPRNLV